MLSFTYDLIFWPEESYYSKVPQAKIIQAKEPLVGDTARIREGTKIHTVKVIGLEQGQGRKANDRV